MNFHKYVLTLISILDKITYDENKPTVTDMTRFVRSDFTYDGMYLNYQGRFVARFKGNTKDKPGFMSFLIKNFTVEEYFAAYDSGVAPVNILATKGYVSKTITDILKRNGYSLDKAGLDAYLSHQRQRFGY